MAKTALELTTDELKSYQPSIAIAQRQRDVDVQLDARWKRARQLAAEAAEMLREEFSINLKFWLVLTVTNLKGAILICCRPLLISQQPKKN